MVSGTDQHGTPVTLKAEQEGVTPKQVVDRYHAEYKRNWEQMGISFDLYTNTGTDNHRQVVHDLFLTLYKKGYIYKDTLSLPYCPTDRRYLPDRYVEGTCPHCGNEQARGDQCGQCGKPLNPEELKNPRCRLDGTPPVFRNSEHMFFKLSAFRDRLLEWVKKQEHWRPNVLNFTLRYLEEGLKDRAITRDIEWGVPVPLLGYEAKRIYVWFEAVTGYLSASKEWAKKNGDTEAWRRFWQDPSCKAYYFMGKDNIPFHTMIWPAMLMGYGDHNLPYDVPANEFLTLDGRPFSTSRNWAVWLPEYLVRYQADSLRYYFSVNMPESADTDFSWREFVRRNNDELVGTYGNLVHRVLTFTYRNYEGRVPEPGPLDEADKALLAKGKTAIEETDGYLKICRFQNATRVFLSLAQQANRYLDTKSPWKAQKKDKAQAATSLWVAINVISCLKTLTYPFMPFNAEKLHRMLGLEGTPQQAGWLWQEIKGGQPLEKPAPLFNKLDEAVIEEEQQRLVTQAR